ncbi:MAG: hypothetical protein OXF09_01815 [Hyphomicrobiales bacterium]|nr:hypothetical protein [Hyphomicrobiales bacterium]
MSVFRLAAIMLPITLLLAACGGRDAEPVMSRQYSDKELTCEQIQDELIELQGDINALIGEKGDARAENVLWGVAGFFFVPLWLGLDLTDTEQIEIQAAEKRTRALKRLARRKDCDF